MNKLLRFPSQYKLKIFSNVHQVSEQDRPYLECAYQAWREAWLDVFHNKMGLNASLYSNDFSRQTYVMALFEKRECIGVAFMREVDFRSKIAVDDSYFRFWPEDILEELRIKHQKVMIASNFTITQAYRRNRSFEWKTLFFALYKDFYNTLDAHLMITAARKLRANEKLCYDVGGICWTRDVPYKSEGAQATEELTDILFWRPHIEFSLLNPQLQKLREEIWRNFQREKQYELLSA